MSFNKTSLKEAYQIIDEFNDKYRDLEEYKTVRDGLQRRLSEEFGLKTIFSCECMKEIELNECTMYQLVEAYIKKRCNQITQYKLRANLV